MKNLFHVFLLSIAVSLVIFIPSCSGGSINSNSSAKDSTAQVTLSDEDRIELNAFFTQLSKNMFSPVTDTAFTDTDLISFGVMYNYNNEPKRFEKIDEFNTKIKSEYVDSAVSLYFGRKIKQHASVQGIEFGNGFYTITEASGEAMYFSQIESLNQNSDATFSAVAANFVAGSGACVDINDSPTQWTGDDKPEFMGKVSARLKKVIHQNTSRYVLLEYKALK